MKDSLLRLYFQEKKKKSQISPEINKREKTEICNSKFIPAL